MIIAHLSDLHIDSHKDIIYGVNPMNNLKQVISIMQQYDGIELGIVTGDITNDGLIESFKIADEALSVLPFPIYFILGNHDDSFITNSKFKKLIFEPTFSFNSIDFISLNTVAKAEDGTNRSSGMITTDEMKRLNCFITESGNDKIIFMHHPATITNSWLDRRILMNRQIFMNTIAPSDNILAVLSGHNHFASDERIGDTLFSTAPSVSTSFDKDKGPFEEVYQPGFNILTIINHKCSVQTIRINKLKLNYANPIFYDHT